MKTNQMEIGGREFTFGTLPATEAVVVEVSIAKVIGEPAFKALMEIDPKEAKAGKVNKEKLMGLMASGIGLITSKMHPDDLLDTMRKVFKYVTINHNGTGERVDIDKHFTGRNKDLWVVFFHALRHNFSDFFPDNLSLSNLASLTQE